MNREREFRAWLIDEKKMVEVDAINFKSEVIFYTVDKEIDGEIIDTLQTRFFKEIELIEYTGLKDKNGVKIFESDIVKIVGYHHSTPHKIEEENFVVVWSFERWVLQRKLKNGGVEETLLGDEDDEVIGNIYENPELLEVEDES